MSDPPSLPVWDKPAPAARYDVIVIGGGINGTGVARDLSLRGLKVCLFERNDIAFGASGNSSGMIHGGLRYLTSNPKVTKDSCTDSGNIQRIAPFLLFRIPFIFPVRKGGLKARVYFELLDAFFRAYDDYQPLKRSEKHTRLDAASLKKLEPGLVGDMIGAMTFDEWGVDGSRLCVLNAVDAMERGADVHVHTSVDAIHVWHDPKAGGKGGNAEPSYVVTAKDPQGGGVLHALGKRVVNATGAWSPVTAQLAGLPKDAVKIRPGKGIHVVFDRRLSNYSILTEAIDGRQIFIEPWENTSVLGTTDDDFYGDLDEVRATSEEVRYLIQGIARVLPSVREARAIGTYAGVRPTLYAYGKSEDALSREHEIVDHRGHGAAGVYSMIGGKLASYRLFAQEMSDLLAKDLAPKTRCTTHEKLLPGADEIIQPMPLADEYELTPVTVRRLVYRHGERARRILLRIDAKPRERTVVCPCEPVLEAEIRYVVKNELARSVDDVARRTRLGYGACGGMRCAMRCGQIVAEELGLPAKVAIEQASRFVDRQAKTRIVALGPVQARQEALAYAHWRSVLGPVPEGAESSRAGADALPSSKQMATAKKTGT